MADCEKIDKSLPHYEVRCFLGAAEPGPKADDEFARLLRLPVGPPYSSDLNSAVTALDHLGWWWHLSHIEAQVTPTTSLKEVPISNATQYDREGHPISYTSCVLERNRAFVLMEAAIKAAYDLPDAYYVVASHIDEVLAKVPWSRKRMMLYYEVREDRRQKAIENWSTANL